MTASASARESAPVVVTEALLANFDRALAVSRFDDRLFDPTVGGDLSLQLDSLLGAVRQVDLDSLARTGGWRSRFVGADLEAQVRFALQRQACEEAFARARAGAQRTRARIDQLEQALPAAEADQTRLAGVAGKAQRMAANIAPPPDTEGAERVRRFQRRMSNLATIIQANALAVAQIERAIEQFRTILDRFADLERVLFPVWERHTLALMQEPPTPEGIGEARKAVRAMVDAILAKAEAGA